MTGSLFVIAGADGCGKDHQAERVRAALAARSVPCWLTQEPWTSPYGVMVRETLRSKRYSDIDPREMAMLFALDRLVHLREIVPRRAAGHVVVSTRYKESSFVYQGAQLEMAGFPDAVEWVRQMNRDFPEPDLTVVLDVPEEVAAQRVQFREGDPDAYEREVELRRTVAARYARLEEYVVGPVVHVDGDRAPEDVFADVWRVFCGATGRQA